MAEPTRTRANDPPVLILTSLAEGDKHGYALLGDIETFAGVRLGPGTLYGAIARLEERGLIEAEWAETPKGRRAKVYSLTRAGKKQLAEEREHWARFSGALGNILEST